MVSPNFSLPTDTLQAMRHSLAPHRPSPSLVAGWRGESEAQKGKIRGLREQFTGNSKRKVTAAMPVPEGARKR